MRRLIRTVEQAAIGAALPLLRRLDPERAHGLGLVGLQCLRPLWPRPAPRRALALDCAGLHFEHPLGLAAGFDKNADYLDALGALGFSHVEIGTVTPRPQPGNLRPRMFRLSAERALVNRMGFNNKGAEYVASRLERRAYQGIVGISIGKNADTPIERAGDDYLAVFRRLFSYADYFAVNVSSPNTARLRELQDRSALERVVGPLVEARTEFVRRGSRRVPIFVKIAPDLDAEALDRLADQIPALAVDGVIATNTSNRLQPFDAALPPGITGGLSGAPLHAKSIAAITRLRARLPRDFPIVGVGGIFDARSALATLAAGANLIQVYTGFAYRGPILVEEILDALERREGDGGG
ncbi:MAG: quinone-dependent dihydroorotate dehydrogenase [Gammaproteobacteria bacterium]|nr:quinone-dependent dihydroorotate dehydrogenase [Gammaproteobacteria bacterium]